jgi:hypothetical protein
MAKNQFLTGKKIKKWPKMQFHEIFYLIFMENIEIFFREIEFFLDFFKFSGLLCSSSFLAYKISSYSPLEV